MESIHQLPLFHANEEITCAVFNPNGINFAVGTSQGNVYAGSLKDDNTGKPKILLGKLENISKTTANSITSV